MEMRCYIRAIGCNKVMKNISSWCTLDGGYRKVDTGYHNRPARCHKLVKKYVSWSILLSRHLKLATRCPRYVKRARFVEYFGDGLT